jgi:hypothetical protein
VPTAPQFAITPNYCLSGLFRGYRGDSADTNGATATQMLNFTTLTGWTPEVVMIGGGINSSLTGIKQHIVYHQKGYPKAGGSLYQMANSPNTSTVPDGSGRTYVQYWQSTVSSLKAQNLWTPQVTIAPMWEGSGGGGWGGMRDNGSIDPGTGAATTTANWVKAYQNLVDTQRNYASSLGLDPALVTYDWNIWTDSLTTSAADALYPGDAYCDFIGWDCYGKNSYGAPARPKTNFDLIWTQSMLPDFTRVTNYARGKGKRIGAGEFGMVELPIGDAKANTNQDFTLADTDLYFKYMSAFVTTNADVWAYVSLFNENQHTSFTYTGSQDMTEDDQIVYFGTDPSTQTYLRMNSTNNTGTAYITPSANHTLSAPAWLSYFRSGNLQKQVAPITPVIGNFQVTKQNPRLNGVYFG